MFCWVNWRWNVWLSPTEPPLSSVPRTVRVTLPRPALELAKLDQRLGSGR